MTKPQLGTTMLGRAHVAGELTSRSWVTADEAYGQNPTSAPSVGLMPGLPSDLPGGVEEG